MDLFDYFINNTGKKITKWTHYFPVYEKHFKALTEKPINILEIGVLNGGSLQMWKKYFHPDSTLVGIDIDPRCKQHEDGDSDINIRIGDQSNPIFLQKLIVSHSIFFLDFRYAPFYNESEFDIRMHSSRPCKVLILLTVKGIERWSK